MLRVEVKPDLLRWARERSGNTIDRPVVSYLLDANVFIAAKRPH